MVDLHSDARIGASSKYSFSKEVTPRKTLDSGVAEMLGLLNLRFSEDENRRGTASLKILKPTSDEGPNLHMSEAFSRGTDNALTGGDITDDDEDEEEEADLYQNNPCPTCLLRSAVRSKARTNAAYLAFFYKIQERLRI